MSLQLKYNVKWWMSESIKTASVKVNRCPQGGYKSVLLLCRAKLSQVFKGIMYGFSTSFLSLWSGEYVQINNVKLPSIVPAPRDLGSLLLALGLLFEVQCIEVRSRECALPYSLPLGTRNVFWKELAAMLLPVSKQTSQNQAPPNLP